MAPRKKRDADCEEEDDRFLDDERDERDDDDGRDAEDESVLDGFQIVEE